jgi:hypothetical protein
MRSSWDMGMPGMDGPAFYGELVNRFLALIRNSRLTASANQRVLSRGCALIVPTLHPSPSGALTRRAAEDATPRHPLLREA